MPEIIAPQGSIVLAQIGDAYHVFCAADHDRQVQSIILVDAPRDGECWCAAWTDDGIRYVSRPRTRRTARRWYRELVREMAGAET